MNSIELLIEEHITRLKKPCIIAIDGRCGAGKTTLANKLYERLKCNVIHMDEFFLQPWQRSEKRLAAAGENVDHERFLKQVLMPLKQNIAFSYRAYNCRSQSMGENISIAPNPITIVEGTYCCHSELFDFYDFRIFMSVDPKTQLERILQRNGAASAKKFSELWIPLEEAYFSAFNIESRCELSVDCSSNQFY